MKVNKNIISLLHTYPVFRRREKNRDKRKFGKLFCLVEKRIKKKKEKLLRNKFSYLFLVFFSYLIKS